MADAANVTTSNILAKRKRPQVSYAEPEYLDSNPDYDSDEDIVVDEDDLSEGDTLYGSRKKPRKTPKYNTRAKKRARLTPPRPSKPGKPFPFLALPAELRDYIYELALTQEGGLTLLSTTKAYRRTIGRGFVADDEASYYCRHRRTRHLYQDNDGSEGNSRESDVADDRKNLIPNLLAVNKQIQAEGVSYLYKQPIILEDTMALHAFLAAIGPRNRTVVSDLTVKGWGNGRGVHKAMNFTSLTLLSTCTNLKSFYLDCNLGLRRQPKQLARQIYRDGHYFFEMFGVVKGRKDAGIDVFGLSSRNLDSFYDSRKESSMDMDESKIKFQTELRRLLGCGEVE